MFNHPWVKAESTTALFVRRFSKRGNMVFDPFIGSGTTAVVADRMGRKFFGCDINPDYVKMALERLEKDRAERQLCLKLEESVGVEQGKFDLEKDRT